MAIGQAGRLIQQLRQAVLARDGGGMTDGQLLECYLTFSDTPAHGDVAGVRQAAFEALVRRHGPMVLSVCRRVLNNWHDAEDAFQATFLVLVRKATSIRPREMVGNWLYGVAYRTALEAKASAARRRVKETGSRTMPPPTAVTNDLWHDLRPLLDQELNRLPDKYRTPVVLCDLEGKPRKEAARQLGWPEGTLSGRLARARRMLAGRLARHKLMVSGGSLAVALAQHSASASVPAPLVTSTVQAATLGAAGQAVANGLVSAQVAALTQGVLKTMLISKLKTATAVLIVVAAVGSGFGGLAYQSHAAGDVGTTQETGALQQPAQTAPETPEERYQKKLQELLDLLAQRAKLEAGSIPSIPSPLRVPQTEEELRKQEEELRKLQQYVQKLEEQLRQREQARLQNQALDELSLALQKLKKITAEEPAKKQAVEEFEKSLNKLMEQLGKNLKLDPKEKPKDPPEDKKPPEGIEGRVRQVSEEGFVTITLGSDAGLQIGQRLHVYRLEPKPEYGGEIRVVELRPTEAVGKVVSPDAVRRIRIDDKVADKLTPNR